MSCNWVQSLFVFPFCLPTPSVAFGMPDVAFGLSNVVVFARGPKWGSRIVQSCRPRGQTMNLSLLLLFIDDHYHHYYLVVSLYC